MTADYLPEDWEPEVENFQRLRFRYPNLNVDDELEAFRDYWAAAAGPSAKKRNWDAAFRTWCRRADVYKARPARTTGPKTGTASLYKFIQED